MTTTAVYVRTHHYTNTKLTHLELLTLNFINLGRIGSLEETKPPNLL